MAFYKVVLPENCYRRSRRHSENDYSYELGSPVELLAGEVVRTATYEQLLLRREGGKKKLRKDKRGGGVRKKRVREGVRKNRARGKRGTRKEGGEMDTILFFKQ